MSRNITGENREQLSLEPLCLDDMITEDNPVRAIEMIVKTMEIPSRFYQLKPNVTMRETDDYLNFGHSVRIIGCQPNYSLILT